MESHAERNFKRYFQRQKSTTKAQRIDDTKCFWNSKSRVASHILMKFTWTQVSSIFYKKLCRILPDKFFR